MEDVKPWYASRTIWASLVAGVAVVLSFFHINLLAADQADLVESIYNIVSAVGVFVAVYGRVTATTMIGSVK